MRLLTAITLLFAALTGLPSFADERITSFNSIIAVLPDGSLDVSENITVNVEQRQIRRGIFREIPTEYVGPLGTKINASMRVISVYMDGRDINWQVENVGVGKSIKIGDPDAVLSKGIHSFLIRYKMSRQLIYFEDRDELYWNVTGNGWNFKIDKAIAEVRLPIGAKATDTTAFTGQRGDQGSHYRLVKNEDNISIFETTNPLKSGEGLTIAVTWPKGFVAEPTYRQAFSGFFIDNKDFIVGVIGTFFLLFYFYFAWDQHGRDGVRKAIYARYEPPKGLAPAICRHIANMGHDSTAVTAAIVSMATKGYLIIQNRGDTITLYLDDEKVPLSLAEQALVGNLFKGKASVDIGGKYSMSFANAVISFEEKLELEEDKYFIRNKSSFYVGCFLGVCMLGAMALVSVNYLTAIIALIFIVIVMSVFLKALKTNISSGSLPLMRMLVIIFPILVVMFLGFNDFPNIITPVFLIFTVIMLLICGVFYHLLKAPTEFGRGVMDEIEGFKLYLSKAEKDRMNFHNPPDKTPELFEKYLPYAIALGVEHEWGEQFDNTLRKAFEASGGQTETYGWYRHGGSHRHFNSHTFTDNLSTVMATSIATATTAPSSSGGGFSGGGSSGGGGGGGGGGGW